MYAPRRDWSTRSGTVNEKWWLTEYGEGIYRRPRDASSEQSLTAVQLFVHGWNNKRKWRISDRKLLNEVFGWGNWRSLWKSSVMPFPFNCRHPCSILQPEWKTGFRDGSFENFKLECFFYRWVRCTYIRLSLDDEQEVSIEFNFNTCAWPNLWNAQPSSRINCRIFL